MKIQKIRLQNIRSYENQEILFPTGSVLLSGDIGCGKTSVLLGIEFALFGLQPSQRGSSLLKNGKKEGSVVLEMELNGRNVIIERSLKRSGKNITQENSSISIDNEKFQGSVTEIKNRVLNLLNYPPEFSKKTNLLYKFTVYTPQEEMKQIILESPETRLNTLRHIFGIDKYKRIAENISVFGSKLRENIRNKEGQLSNLEDFNKNLQEKKENLMDLLEKRENEESILSEKKQKVEESEKQVREVEGKVREKENLEKEKEKADIMFANKKETFIEVENQLEKLKSEIQEGKKIIFDESRFNEIVSAIERNKSSEKDYQEKIIRISSQLNSLLERKKETDDLKEKIYNLKSCPTCLQDVNDEYKSNIFKKIDYETEGMSRKSEQLKMEKTRISSSLESLRKQTVSLEQKKSEEEVKKIKLENLKEKESSLAEIEKRKKQTENDIEMMSHHIKSLEENIKSYSQFQETFKLKQEELQEKVMEERRQEIKLAELNKEASFIRQQISELEEQIKEKQKLKEKTEYLKHLESWLSDKFLNLILFTEKNVMLKLREEFSKLFSEWFSVLVPESLTARLDEQFSPIIEQQGFEISYNYLSGGERTSVALAYRLALNQVINSLLSRIMTRDLIILDEPTDGFSETQLDKMRDVLSQLKAEQLILVSHEAKIESFVENIIKFRKENNITRIEE
jgi:exonuclease SbcC